MEQQKRMNLKIDEKVGEGVYANMFVIAYSAAEFILDFGRFLPGLPDARILSRIITTPQQAKRLHKILEKNLEKFENQHGEIKMPGEPGDKPFGFTND